MVNIVGGFSHKCYHRVVQTTRQQLSRSLEKAKPVLEHLDKSIIGTLAGRLDADKDAVILSGITAKTGVGKSTTIKAIMRGALGLPEGAPINPNPHMLHVDGDMWFKDKSKERALVNSFDELLEQGHNFDVPDAVDLPAMAKVMRILGGRGKAMAPRYEYGSCASIPNATPLHPTNFVVVDSIFALHKAFNKPQNPLLDFGMMVKIPESLQWERFAKRAPERGQTVEVARVLFDKANAEAEKHLPKTADMVIDGAKPLTEVAQRLAEFVKVIARV